MMQSPEKHDPYRSCTLSVEGPRADELLDAAIQRAAVFLRERPEDLIATHVGDATVTKRSRFRPHLGVEAPPIRWRATITVKLRPEVVRARRGETDEQPTPAGRRPGRRRLRPVT
jgi:hypothetical protein